MGYNLGKNISLKNILPYYVENIYQYIDRIDKKDQEKTI